MNTSNLFPATINLPSVSLAHDTALTKADAWRKTLEKEQTELLRQSKSVPLGEASGALFNATQASATARPTTQAGLPQAPRAVPNETHEMAASLQTEPPPPLPIPFRPGTQLQRTTELQPGLLNEKQMLQLRGLSSAGGELTIAIAWFESHYKQKWPLKNVHVAHSAEGTTVWIRDARLHADSEEISALIQHIGKALEQDGQKLAALVINGKTVY